MIQKFENRFWPIWDLTLFPWLLEVQAIQACSYFVVAWNLSNISVKISRFWATPEARVPQNVRDFTSLLSCSTIKLISVFQCQTRASIASTLPWNWEGPGGSYGWKTCYRVRSYLHLRMHSLVHTSGKWITSSFPKQRDFTFRVSNELWQFTYLNIWIWVLKVSVKLEL